ncbi:MAG: tRNA (adenosine(37)-N6)-threonylcarbamoyltransferase complex ATPase subunit type 1 TsaE [Patescibacteria group bacterium]|nr:tRNA (adenosine(37)-N6)-threonylcarbamoyltransferase complex ATPase subunit type 1 TsaE [Patescibacteria group bacterium]
MEVFETKSASETENLGNDLAESLRLGSGAGKFVSMYRYIDTTVRDTDRAFAIALNGELGAGKTTFIKGLAKGLGIKEVITSPTYVFVRSYSFKPIIRQSFHKDALYHLDLYRLENQDKKTLQSFGFDEILSDPKGIVVVEWAERLESSTYRSAINLDFNYLGKNRQIKVYCR